MELRSSTERWTSWALSTIALTASVLVLVWAWTAWDARAVAEWKSAANPVFFFSAMAILPGLGLPITPFYVLAGATFGVAHGLLGCMLAVAVHFALSHAITRGSLGSALRRLLQRFGYRLPDYGHRQGALRFATVVKLAPGVPGFFKNYLLGLAGVPFGLYMGVCMAFAAAYAFPLMLLGDSLSDHDGRRVLAAIAMIAVLLLGVFLWRRRCEAQRAELL